MNREIELIGDIELTGDIELIGDIELTGDIEGANDNVANVIIREPKPQSCWGENKSALLFLFTAALGFLWVGLNLGGYV